MNQQVGSEQLSTSVTNRSPWQHLTANGSCPQEVSSGRRNDSVTININKGFNFMNLYSLADFQSSLKSHFFTSVCITHTPAPQIRPSTFGAI